MKFHSSLSCKSTGNLFSGHKQKSRFGPIRTNMDVDETVRNSDIDISIRTEELQCTVSTCIEDKDINKLQCGQCKRKVHYKCSRLPAYQLQRYLVASLGQFYSKFLCQNCVNVPDSILKEMTISDNVVSLENEITMQKEKIEAYEKELSELRNIVATKQGLEQATSKKRKIGERSNSSDKISHKDNIDNNNEPKEPNHNSQTIQELNQMFEARFEKIETKMIEIIQKVLPTSTQDNSKNPIQSYANAARPDTPVNNDFRNLIIAAKNEERIEERDKKVRENNIIIHGCIENDSDDQDKTFVHDMLKEISVGIVNTKSITRVGKADSGKTRPIKVSFSNIDEKIKVMSNLRFLKGKETYNKVSITEDYTISERKMIKDYVERAKQQNRELGDEAKSIVVVRGSPKNGLYLKEIMKEKRAVTLKDTAQTNQQ